MGLPRSEETDRLFEAILSLKTTEQCYMFFEDVCTINEVQEMGQRLSTAEMLSRGENYGNIQKKIGVSTATISRVNRCLNYGSGGYALVLDRPEDKKE